MDGDDVLVALRQEGVDVLAEQPQHGQRARVVVLEGEALDGGEVPFEVVGALDAEVVDAVVARVARVEEALHLGHGVAVHALDARGGEAHGDEPRRDVRQVQVEAVLLEAPLLLRDQAADRAGHRNRNACDSLVQYFHSLLLYLLLSTGYLNEALMLGDVGTIFPVFQGF